MGPRPTKRKTPLQKLTQATGDPTKALGLLSTAADLAAAKHEDLVTASGQLGKAYNGSGRILKDFGITMGTTGNKTRDGTAAIGELSTKLTGQATAAASTFGGKLDELKAKFEDQVATLGQKYGPALTAAGAP